MMSKLDDYKDQACGLKYGENSKINNGWVTVKSKAKKNINCEGECHSHESDNAKLETKENEEAKIQAKLLKKISIKDEKMRKREERIRLSRQNLNKDTRINLVSHESDNAKLETKENEEAKIQAKLLKKIRIKDEKMRKREERIRLSRQNLNKDTRINLVSQNLIESFNKRSNNERSNQISFHTNNIEEYPSISMSSKSTRKNIKKQNTNAQNNSFDNNFVEKNYCSTDSLSPEKYKQYIPENKQASPTINNDLVEIKKKVKTKDPINLEIVSLIEETKNKKKNNPSPKLNSNQVEIKKIVGFPTIERRGKVRNRKKKLSTLRKNILRQKNNQVNELLYIKDAEKELLENERKTVNENEFSSENFIEINSPIIKESNKNLDYSENSFKENRLENVEYSEETTAKNNENNSTRINCNKENNLNPSDCFKNDAIAKEIKILKNPIHNRKFREYCDHIIAPEINEAIEPLIELIVFFQDRLHRTDPIKAKMRRRYYCGLKETIKHMNDLKLIILAPNLKPSPGAGCVDELVSILLNKASEHHVPVVFGLNRNKIGRLCYKKVPVSCFAIVNYDGAEVKFNRLMTFIPWAKERYEKLLSLYGLPEDNLEEENNSPELVQEEHKEITDINHRILKSLKIVN